MKKYNKIFGFTFYLIIVLGISLFYAIACNTNSTEPEKEISLPDSNLNYIEHIQPLLITKCGSRNGCHGSFEPARGLDLTDYQLMISHIAAGNQQLIIPGSSEVSFLYNILQGQVLNVPRMPLYEPKLEAKYIQGIKQWIDEGAEEFP